MGCFPDRLAGAANRIRFASPPSQSMAVGQGTSTAAPRKRPPRRSASASFARLVRNVPGIEKGFGMYRDMLPIRLHADGGPLIARKLVRSAVSRVAARAPIRALAGSLGESGRLPGIARPLCRLALSGAICSGLREEKEVARADGTPPAGGAP